MGSMGKSKLALLPCCPVAMGSMGKGSMGSMGSIRTHGASHTCTDEHCTHVYTKKIKKDRRHAAYTCGIQVGGSNTLFYVETLFLRGDAVLLSHGDAVTTATGKQGNRDNLINFQDSL